MPSTSPPSRSPKLRHVGRAEATENDRPVKDELPRPKNGLGTLLASGRHDGLLAEQGSELSETRRKTSPNRLSERPPCRLSDVGTSVEVRLPPIAAGAERQQGGWLSRSMPSLNNRLQSTRGPPQSTLPPIGGPWSPQLGRKDFYRSKTIESDRLGALASPMSSRRRHRSDPSKPSTQLSRGDLRPDWAASLMYSPQARRKNATMEMPIPEGEVAPSPTPPLRPRHRSTSPSGRHGPSPLVLSSSGSPRSCRSDPLVQPLRAFAEQSSILRASNESLDSTPGIALPPLCETPEEQEQEPSEKHNSEKEKSSFLPETVVTSTA